MGQNYIINRGIFYYQLGQALLQNWGNFVNYYQSGQLLQIRATVITNWGSYYNLWQTLLQIRAAIINWGNYYKLGHHTVHQFENALYRPLHSFFSMYLNQYKILTIVTDQTLTVCESFLTSTLS